MNNFSSAILVFFKGWFRALYVCLCVYVAKVTMADRAAAERACKDPNPIIDGRKANVNLAYLGAKPRIMQPGEMQESIGYRPTPLQTPTTA